MLDMEWLAFYKTKQRKVNIAESNLIWVAKNEFFFFSFPCEWPSGKNPDSCPMTWRERENWKCLVCRFAPNRIHVKTNAIKKSVADYLTTNFTLPYRQLFIAHTKIPTKTMQQVRVNKKIMINETYIFLGCNLLSLFTCNKNIQHKTTTYLREKISSRVLFPMLFFSGEHKFVLCFLMLQFVVDAEEFF